MTMIVYGHWQEAAYYMLVVHESRFYLNHLFELEILWGNDPCYSDDLARDSCPLERMKNDGMTARFFTFEFRAPVLLCGYMDSIN